MKQFVVVVIILSLLGHALALGDDRDDSHADHDGHSLREDGHHEDDGHGHSKEDLDAVQHDNHHGGAFSVMCSLVTTQKGSHKDGAHVEIQLVEPKAIGIDIDWETMPVNKKLTKEVHLHLNEETRFEVTTTKEGDETVKGRHTIWVNTTKVEDDHDGHDHAEYVFNITVESHSSKHLILYKSEESTGRGKGKLSQFIITNPADTKFEIISLNGMYGIVKLTNCIVVDDYDLHEHDHEEEVHDPNDGEDHSSHDH